MVRSGMGFNVLFVGLLIAICVYAFWRGGAPERIGASIFAAGSVLTVVVASVAPIRFRSVEVGMLIVDVATALAFTILALKANRFWPIWVSALLGLRAIGHLAKLLSPQVIPWAYQVALTIWSYPILLLVGLGLAAVTRRRWSGPAQP